MILRDRMARLHAGPHIGRSIWAVVAGSLLVVILSLGTDEILHLIHVYSPWGQPMFAPSPTGWSTPFWATC